MTYEVAMTADAVTGFLEDVFPEMNRAGRIFTIDTIEPGRAIVRARTDATHLRPGGTVSGPTLFSLADFAAYVVILGHIGPQALAVTTNLNINFLTKAGPGDLIARCRILKLGTRLVVTDCDITADGSDDLIAQASATYSIPPAR